MKFKLTTYNMKQNVLFAGLFAAAAMFTSCNTGGDDGNYSSMGMGSCNLVIPSDASKEVSVQSDGNYTFKFYLDRGTAVITSTSINLGGDKVVLHTDELPYNTYLFGNNIQSINVKANNAGMASNHPVTNLNCNLVNSFWWDDILATSISGIPSWENLRTGVLELSYDVDGYTVRTFGADRVYKGETMTQVDSSNGLSSYSTTEMLYRVVMNVDKKKADVVLYRAKFSDQMPVTISAMVLKDLDLSFSRNGFIVSGTDVVPAVAEGISTTPYPNFTFKTFNLYTVNLEMTNVIADFTVGNAYTGYFEGTCNITNAVMD